MNRLQHFVDIAAMQKVDERLGDYGLVLSTHREVRILPPSQHAKALKFLAMNVDELSGVGAALGANVRNAHRRFTLAKLLIDLEFNRQAVAIPAWNIRRIKSRHALGLHNEVL